MNSNLQGQISPVSHRPTPTSTTVPQLSLDQASQGDQHHLQSEQKLREPNPTILVVEDEAMLALTIELELQDAGFQVVVAHSGDMAIVELEEDPQRFSAVVTDIRMPGKASGWDVGRRARELRQELPVLYVSGDSAANWRANGVPGSAMLAKPFPLEKLVSILTNYLQE